MADAAGTTRGRDERGDGGGRARASTTATAARSRIRSLRLARGGAPSWAAGAERWVRVSAGAAAERPGWESARWRGRTDDGGGRGGGEGAPNGTRWGRHGGGVCGGGGVPFWVGSAATSVRHGTILRTDFFFLFFRIHASDDWSTGGGRGKKRRGDRKTHRWFSTIWARLVQLREQLHEQLHNFNSQTTNSLPNSPVSFSENSLSQS
jgi:hypothetical protein